jgi:hypothetical protein
MYIFWAAGYNLDCVSVKTRRYVKMIYSRTEKINPPGGQNAASA